MIKDKRINKIEEYIKEHKSVSLDELMEVFKVSKNTIRRDVQELVERDEFKKVYGGVAVKDEDQTAKLEPFQDRQVRHQKEKKIIAKAAAQFINDGDIIFIDSGTTTIELIEYLKGKNVTVLTNNLDFILRALPFENLSVISTGGLLERKTNSFGSIKYIDFLNAYNIKKAFMASTGVSLTNGVTNASPLESELKTAVVNRSIESYLLIDHNKFDKYGLMTYCTLDNIDYLITDQMPSQTYKEYIEANDIKLVLAEDV
ncbi:DeoR/GlpR family DNA-binding transcription regulator [Metabacillus rhizolycopersici]|uniref:DeoR/GlpR family DNA-binding transcription regulator n=1 Tax=Metabacillus rhizolycopersici TaxID=2875709 RepID=A0ABS7UL07_9BACI|nr:DeoR/GlpR family DNA-binding transcription regulator [Metabacillus rhizolycopersici]MBZ5749000.1 DeoR/GlpR family DNA-binding transcription regulator [Metabacillus rhizolycopersici]